MMVRCGCRRDDRSVSPPRSGPGEGPVRSGVVPGARTEPRLAASGSRRRGLRHDRHGIAVGGGATVDGVSVEQAVRDGEA